MTHHLYLGLGSNLGHREQIIQSALALINHALGKVERISSFYETEPWGFESEHKFLNIAAFVLTDLSPHECLYKTQEIERQLGRKQKSTDGIYHDRPIDIDILLYDHLKLSTPDLIIPHPLIKERDFVLIPLKEIYPSDSELCL